MQMRRNPCRWHLKISQVTMRQFELVLGVVQSGLEGKNSRRVLQLDIVRCVPQTCWCLWWLTPILPPCACPLHMNHAIRLGKVQGLRSPFLSLVCVSLSRFVASLGLLVCLALAYRSSSVVCSRILSMPESSRCHTRSLCVSSA